MRIAFNASFRLVTFGLLSNPYMRLSTRIVARSIQIIRLLGAVWIFRPAGGKFAATCETAKRS